MLKELLEKYEKKEDLLLEILLECQVVKSDHFISKDDIKEIADYLSIPESKVCSVLSFYTFFSDKPRGKYIIQVCKDIPCYISSDVNVLNIIEKELGIRVNETTSNKQFTLEYTSCLGCCEAGPVMRINDKIYTHLTADKIKAILSEYRVYM
ncbi:NADH-quinone oxidoreductase subunit NuoE family protein [Mariniplasma anaerobium]|uniref:NADH-quinone oxidoreductase subunit E n=1 Tax=Mariniplasma anaerobium TaxID=2735436 RepID=A0A7U9TGS4_9MOLU|nr:NAD(P)H-dependent oxidoreductase subunit E [Mariniplasma anaerobium]BCR35913.1 NADH-quinone oxidoreductase subunit E [Mariniplasma anaerobium]